MTAPDPTAGEPHPTPTVLHDWTCSHDPCACVTPPAVAASTGTSEDEPNIVQRIVNAWDCCGTCAGGVLARHVADRESAARAEERERIAQAQRCGGCKGQGSHRRHCPRHPNYHPWVPLADRAESIGDSIGEPGLANQAWALAGAIRDEMPNHPYRPARLRDEGGR